MARKSRKNVIPQESTAFPDKEKKVLLRLDYMRDCPMKRKRTLREGQSKHRWSL